MRGFGSDNHAPIHPQILRSITENAQDHAPSYGTDPLTLEVQKTFKHIFGEQSETHFVFNGTAANVLSLKTLMKSYESCFVTDCSHMNVDECGAPEFFAGKLIALPSHHGKFIFEDLEKNFIRLGDQHFAQPKVISLTQPTELGTVYTFEELNQIITLAKSKKMLVHIDGARFTNAVSFLKCEMRDLTTRLGVDILSFGGTKNGLLFGEAVVILNPQFQKDFKFIRKQAAQLPSKTRYIACQFKAFFAENLHQKIAQHSHNMALLLEKELKSHCPQIRITQTVQSNAVFCQIPQAWIKTLKKSYFFYVWNENTFECRLMMSWDTQKSDIDGFINCARDLARLAHDQQP